MSHFDPDRYAQLLAEARPALIEDPDEHERLLTIAEALMDKGEAITPEEERLLGLLVLVIEAFEAEVDEAEGGDEDERASAEPHETLQRLLQSRGLEPSDLTDVFGNPQAAREALTGSRAISRGQAKQLARLFQVPAKIFLPLRDA